MSAPGGARGVDVPAGEVPPRAAGKVPAGGASPRAASGDIPRTASGDIPRAASGVLPSAASGVLSSAASGDPTFAVVVVAFNSAAVLPECLAALPPDVALTVVDNASTDNSAALVRQLAPAARVLALPRNVGFGNAANHGFEGSAATHGLLLNPDARCGPGMLAALRAAAVRYPDAAMLAPAVHDPAGRLSFGRHGLFDRPFRGAGPDPVGDCCCAYVGGPAMLLRLAAFRALGGFDPDLFLYAEDDDLCFRLRRAGHALVHVAGATLMHGGGRSTSGVAALDRRKAWHVGWSRLHVVAKHRGRPAAIAYGLRELARRGLLLATRPGDRRRVRWAGEAAGMLAFLRGRRAMAVGLDVAPRDSATGGEVTLNP